jgi:hypothetical protein
VTCLTQNGVMEAKSHGLNMNIGKLFMCEINLTYNTKNILLYMRAPKTKSLDAPPILIAHISNSVDHIKLEGVDPNLACVLLCDTNQLFFELINQ